MKFLRSRIIFLLIVTLAQATNLFAHVAELEVRGYWNTYLRQLNFAECSVITNSSTTITFSLLDNSGNILGSESHRLPGYGTVHIPINNLGGLDLADRYGTYTAHASSPIYCHTAVYRLSEAGSMKPVDYAYSMPTSTALRGASYGVFNSMNPAARPQPVNNWLSLVNLSDAPFEATITLYGLTGEQLAEIHSGTLSPGQRRDFPIGHDRGQVVGLFRVTPASNQLPYSAFSIRYSPDENRFNFAFPVQNLTPSCDPGPVPASTMGPADNWGEVANINPEPRAFLAEVRDQTGTMLHEETFTLPPYAQRHFPLHHWLGLNNLGSFRVRCVGSNDGGVYAQSLYYGHLSAGDPAVEWAYASQGSGRRIEVGQTVATSINTFFGARNWAKFHEQSGNDATLLFNIRDQQGMSIGEEERALRANGSVDYPLHQQFPVDRVGVGLVQLAQAGARYNSETLRVIYRQDGRIGYIFNLPGEVTGESGAGNSSSASSGSSSSSSSVPLDCLIPEDTVNGSTPLIRSELINGRLAMTDISNPASPQVLVSPSAVALSFGTNLVPTTTLRTTRNGADITLTYTNNTGVPQPMGNIGIGGLELGRYIERYDFRQGAELVQRDLSLQGDGADGRWWEGHSAPGSAFRYPDDLFSPVEVFRGAGAAHTMAISLQYPVLEYKQAVRVQFSRRFGDWRSDVSFWLLGELPTGQSRSYTVSVRVVRSTDNWLRALLPYRNYLREHYGGVTYDRDPRPVYAPVTGQQFLVSPTNPYGYSDNVRQRPDLYGWGPWANIILNRRASGFERAMMWAPTGHYAEHHNYPQLFMTPMLTRPMMSTTMDELRRIPASGMQMGYYQGHAGRIHHTWEDPSPVFFDMTNPDHLRRGFAEFDVAASLDADFIGFDAISELPLWDALRWTEMLQARSSRPVRFLGELSPSDLWLRKHASFVFRSQIYGPDLLADFFLPGHEIWSGIRYDVLYPGLNPVPASIILQEMRDVAHEGRVPLPLSFAQLQNPSEYYAARSWEYTVPEELRDPCYPLEHP